MHTGKDLVNDANLFQDEKGHDDYDFNNDVENGNDDDGRFMQNAYWADLVNDANLLQEEDLQGDQPAPELPPPVGLAFAKLSR